MKENKIIYQTAIALSFACALLVLFVLPAEYNIDPTGIGKILGLTAISNPEYVSHPDPEPAPAPAINSGSETAAAEKVQVAEGRVNVHEGPPAVHTVTLSLKPFEEVEYKAYLPVGEPIFYYWFVEGGAELYYDFHGDSAGDELPVGYSQQYQDGEASNSRGSMAATLTGHHGWYWLNYSEQELLLTLHVTGYYREIGEIYRGFQQGL